MINFSPRQDETIQNPEEESAVLFLEPSGILMVKYSDGNILQIASTEDVEAVRPYKVYTALLSQSGTSAPVATVLENTLGGTVVWTRTDVGVYRGTLTGYFVQNKTFFNILFTTSTGDSSKIKGIGNTSDYVYFQTTDFESTPFDANTESPFPVEIRVYP